MQTQVGVATRHHTLGARIAACLADTHLVRIETEEDLWIALSREQLDLLVLDHDFPAGELTSSVSVCSETIDVVVLSSDDSAIERARLTASGATAILNRDLGDEPLADALSHLVHREAERMRHKLSSQRVERSSNLSDFVVISPAMQHFIRLARRVVSGARSLLILGETGVGKERVARSLHAESPRSAGPFIAVNCGALSESLLESELFGHEEGAFTGASRARRGYFELADKGTIFLDEIGEMPLHLQVKLLRVLEDRHIQRVGGERSFEVDVRFMAATNRDLHREMEEGRFRPDLYYRLAVVSLTVPPLRQRREDILELARTFLGQFRDQFVRSVDGFTEDARRALVDHDWPGNVRELLNVIERAVLLANGPSIRLEDLRGGEAFSRDTGVAGPSSGGSSELVSLTTRPLASARRLVVADFEAHYLEELLRDNHGRIGRSARQAGISERTLYALMKRHGLSKEGFKQGQP